ncbi:hypothetical protein [Tropicimonas sediminicola]|uniref:Uncharacterized protein n=1 Tax=Tropicimonas sediminicola TaxID=1031541 RepID=A0A239M7E6_9RHOB|nr:hypothetical protein [Tropicimonas sediminicola]SNT38043.1 hypothetical protein SAMN05421757_11363 [Tropicimonas sediminicola]
MIEPLYADMTGRLMAHRVFIERLVYRLREVEGFQSSGLVNDIARLEAEIHTQLENAGLPDNLIEACEDELRQIGASANAGRTR